MNIYIPAIKEAYITLKDHKPGFPENIKCRLINPTKSNIEIISKKILDDINNKIKDKLELKQLKNTEEAINWFDNIPNKNNSLLLMCDIVDFYPSINENLFTKTIQFAEKHTTINETQKRILLNARQSLLHFDNSTWVKQNGIFDVTMGAYDGAQISDLVGLYILHTIKEKIPEIDFALYRDDGIAHHTKMKPQRIDKIRKKLHDVFNEIGLKITVETTLTKVNYLDITMNINDNTYEPFRKPNDTPIYIHNESNHPPHVKKNIPIAVNKRLTTISSSNELFDQHKNEYQIALNKSKYFHKLTFDKKSNNNDIHNKQRLHSSCPTSRNIKDVNISNSYPNCNPRRSQRIQNKTNIDRIQNTHSSCDKFNQNETKKTKDMNNTQNNNNIKKSPPKPKKKNRNRSNVTYFNPPFSLGLKTNIGKQFLSLIDKHFPTNNHLSIALNRHNIKLSYSTTKNMEAIIAAHNRKILNPRKENIDGTDEKCNCRLTCPIPEGCRKKAVVYKAEVKGALYIGMTQTEIRSRIRRHRHSFKAEYKRNETNLSGYIWDRKLNQNDNGEIIEPDVKWSIVRQCKIYQPGSKNCDLCLSEKLNIIMNQKNRKCINKKTDISNYCNHVKSYFYSNYKKDTQPNNDIDFVY